MSAELSGFVATLSGRVNTLNSSLTYLNQNLLTRPDLAAFEQFQVIWNQQFDQLSASITNMQAQLQSLQTLYVNLYRSVVDNYSTFTGHTGDPTAHAE